MIYGLEALTKRWAELEVAELKMLKLPLVVTRMDSLEMSTSDEQLSLSGLETKLVKAKLKFLACAEEG